MRVEDGQGRSVPEMSEEGDQMRTLRIGGRRLKCKFCKRYAVMTFCKVPICGRCLRAFFVGHMVGRNAEYDEIQKKYDLVLKKEGKA